MKEEINYQPIKKKVVQKKIKGSNFNNIVNKEETIKFKDIFLLDDKELINWCLDVKLLKKSNNCKSCRNKTGKVVYVRLSQNKKFVDKYVWRCLNKDCSWTEHIRKGNKLFDEFPRIKLRIILIYIFTHFTVLFSPIHSHKMLGISLKTIHKLSMMLSSWIINKQLKIENDIGQFGGPKSIVEIDESCFFKRKDNKGRLQKQLWGFGIVERSNGRLFVEIVPNRSSKVLVQIIEKWIKKDTKFLISDEWRAYSKLRSLG